MFDPKYFSLSTQESLFIGNLWILLNLIYKNKIINYDVEHPEKYRFFWNNRIIEIIEHGPISKEMLQKINSVEKITSHHFIDVIKMQFPDFDETKFFQKSKEYFFHEERILENIILVILTIDYFENLKHKNEE